MHHLPFKGSASTEKRFKESNAQEKEPVGMRNTPIILYFTSILKRKHHNRQSEFKERVNYVENKRKKSTFSAF